MQSPGVLITELCFLFVFLTFLILYFYRDTWPIVTLNDIEKFDSVTATGQISLPVGCRPYLYFLSFPSLIIMFYFLFKKLNALILVTVRLFRAFPSNLNLSLLQHALNFLSVVVPVIASWPGPHLRPCRVLLWYSKTGPPSPPWARTRR